MLSLETRSRLETVSRPVSEVLVLVLVLNVQVLVLVLVLNVHVLVLVLVLSKNCLEICQDRLSPPVRQTIVQSSRLAPMIHCLMV